MAKKKMMMKPKEGAPMMGGEGMGGGMMGSSRLQMAMKKHGFGNGTPSQKPPFPPKKKKKKKGK